MNIERNDERILIKYVDSNFNTFKCVITTDDVFVVNFCRRDLGKMEKLLLGGTINEMDEYYLLKLDEPVFLEYKLKKDENSIVEIVDKLNLKISVLEEDKNNLIKINEELTQKLSKIEEENRQILKNCEELRKKSEKRIYLDSELEKQVFNQDGTRFIQRYNNQISQYLTPQQISKLDLIKTTNTKCFTIGFEKYVGPQGQEQVGLHFFKDFYIREHSSAGVWPRIFNYQYHKHNHSLEDLLIIKNNEIVSDRTIFDGQVIFP